MKATIYALVDPNTSQVRYVGQTSQTAAQRFRHHLSVAKAGKNAHPVYPWIRSLSPRGPVLVILQEGIHVQSMKDSDVLGGAAYWNTATAAETKWMKRFEKTGHLLCDVPRKSRTYQMLVNPPTVRAMKKK